MRRFARLTSAFSKKLEHHVLALALYFTYYNFVKVHKSLANPYPRTPAMAAGVADHIWTPEEVVKLVGVNLNASGWSQFECKMIHYFPAALTCSAGLV